MTTVVTNSPTPKAPPPPATNGHKPAAVEELDLSLVRESPVNPRKVFRNIEELAADVNQHGVLQPLTVRRISDDGKKRFEIVFGARRFRAAKLAALVSVPCIIRELDDLEAYERMVVENGQREDLHPLEEAESYEHLHTKHMLSVEEIASKVGQNKAHV